MLRAAVFAFSLFLMPSIVFAGFEWVPPAQKPAPIQQAAPVDNIVDNFPAPTVEAQPLAAPEMSNAPVSILPHSPVTPRSMSAVRQKQKNLSGKKLVIDPYPLRNQSSGGEPSLNVVDMYKAMSEESGNLHPVKLGSGLSTSAKKKYVSQPIRMADVQPKRFLTPIQKSGMTPMIGKEPAPLSDIGMRPRAPVELSAPSRTYDKAIGFGRDLPLALALSQVVPSEFTHSFAADVDTGAIVSWEGGKPWNQVLNDMLRSKNLTSVIKNNQVIIQPMAKL